MYRRLNKLDASMMPVVCFALRAHRRRGRLRSQRHVPLAALSLGLVFEQQGKYEDAINEFKQVVNLTGGKPLGTAALARAYALVGRRAVAQKILNELEQLSKERFISPVTIALIFSALGEKDRHLHGWTRQLRLVMGYWCASEQITDSTASVLTRA